jgi:hypothetical protein
MCWSVPETAHLHDFVQRAILKHTSERRADMTTHLFKKQFGSWLENVMAMPYGD